ncbi:MAG: hypothetical protein DHS20C18_34430 [Saprospiraceae bacterium]|nr:MAG: hypothetical protein DHS20C18_34430 [Saprospiraceae bacterium]
MKTSRTILYLSLFSIVLFFMLTSLAMQVYPGGTIHDRSSEGYTFWHNYFSDLGRTRAWNKAPNLKSSLLFKGALLIAGGCLLLFFAVLPRFFKGNESKGWATLAAILGILAALCYWGIALNPLDVNYGMHTIFVRAGFIAFLLMSIFYTIAIFRDPTYPNHYAYGFLVFGVVLFIQISIMLFGPRAWTSPHALFLQASAQKIVVYAQMLVLGYQCLGLLRRKVE